MQRFPIRRSPWALPFLAPLAARRPYAEVGDGRVVVSMGALGRADIPVALIDRVGTMSWPWWGGVGARIARGLVAFVGASGGTLVLIELSGPLRVRAPLGLDGPEDRRRGGGRGGDDRGDHRRSAPSAPETPEGAG